LVGEGPHDIGDLADHPTYRRGREGFLQPVVRRLAGSGVTFDGQKITQLPSKRLGDAASAMRRRAGQALSLANANGADMVVFATDLDRTGGTRASATERRRRWKERSDDIQAGFDAARAQTPALACTRAVAAIPCRMVESWALGDRRAVASVAEGALGCEWSEPEALWGKEGDPSSSHPKCVIDRALGRRHTREDLAAIAKAADIDTLVGRCPLSFKPFARAFRWRTGPKLS
jgi:hypothetical protein